MSEDKEPSALQKIQQEYNQLAALMGHNRCQLIVLEQEYARFLDRADRLIKKMSNIPKSELEPKEEIKNDSAT